MSRDANEAGTDPLGTPGGPESACPRPIRRWCRWFLQPKAKWIRLPLGLLLIVGGLLGFLPILGFWMIPLGVLMVGEDIPFVRRAASRAIRAAKRWRAARRTR